MRQFRTVEVSTPNLARIEEISTPFMVIHGTDDTLLPLAHGRDIARRVPEALIVEVEGMGHDLEGDLPRIVADHALCFIETIKGRARPPKD